MPDFVFADAYRLEEGPVHDFHRRFLKGLVHKQNNSLGAISGFSSLMLAEPGLPADARENVEEMSRSAKAATDLNQRVLTAAGCSTVELSGIQLGDQLPYACQEAASLCEKLGTSFQSSIAPDLPAVRGDSGKIHELVRPLIQNAAEAAARSEAKAVSLDVLAPGQASESGGVDLFVRNSDSDRSGEDLAGWFAPFKTSKTGEHPGIGLTAAAVLAGQMGMRLGLCHDQETTTAWVSLPLAG